MAIKYGKAVTYREELPLHRYMIHVRPYEKSKKLYFRFHKSLWPLKLVGGLWLREEPIF